MYAETSKSGYGSYRAGIYFCIQRAYFKLPIDQRGSHALQALCLLCEPKSHFPLPEVLYRKKELEAAEKRIADLSAIFKRLYEDSVAGRISDERFTELSADYEAEQKELKEKAALQGELSKMLEATAR